jgi:hypothetical protein
MITVHKQVLRGTPDDVRATAEHLARGQDDREYLAGTRLRELAVELAACNGLTVSAVRYDDMAGYELEVTLQNAPHLDPVVIGRSRMGDQCQVTLECWLPVDGEPGIKDAVDIIHAILTASASHDPAKIIGTPAEP